MANVNNSSSSNSSNNVKFKETNEDNFYRNAKRKYQEALEHSLKLTTRLKKDNNDIYKEELFYAISNANDACEFIIKALCIFYNLGYSNDHFVQNHFNDVANEIANLAINDPELIKNFNEANKIYTQNNILFKRSNQLHSSTYHNNDPSFPYFRLNDRMLDQLFEVYECLSNYYVRAKSRAYNEYYLIVSKNSLQDIRSYYRGNYNLFVSNIDIIQEEAKKMINNLLTFILSFNKIDHNISLQEKFEKALDNSNIGYYEKFIKSIINEELIHLNKNSELDENYCDIFVKNLAEIYDFCDDLNF
mgnify:CR=1 FL=1